MAVGISEGAPGGTSVANLRLDYKGAHLGMAGVNARDISKWHFCLMKLAEKVVNDLTGTREEA